MNNLLAGVKEGEERHSHADLFTRGVEVVECVLRNLDSESLFELRETISQIATLCISSQTAYMQELTQLAYKKTPPECKKIAKKVLASGTSVKMVTVGLLNPKKAA